MNIEDIIAIIALTIIPLAFVGIIQMLLDYRERKRKVEEELSKMWDRIEWLCKDTDDRLSVDRLEFQQKAKQISHLWRRLRYVEKKLYIEPSDAFKEKEDGGDD